MQTANREKLYGKRNRHGILIAVLIVLMIFSSFCFAFAAQDSEKRETIKVGYPLLQGVHEVDSNGYHRGYNYEYLQEIARYDNLEYEFVIDTWDNCMKGLKDGSIDIMGFVAKSAAREEFLEYTEMSEGVANILLVAKEENQELQYMDIETLQNRKVGVIAGSALEKLLDKFCEEENLHIEKVYYRTERILLNALDSGYIDLVLSTNFELGDDAKIIAEFNSEPFYFVVSKARDKDGRILYELDDAMKEIFILEPNYNQKLFNSYISGKSRKVLNLTEEEKNFIKESVPIKVVYDPNWMPLSYCDKGTGEMAGAIAYLFNQITENTGLKFEFIKAKDYTEALNLVKEGKADIISNFVKDYSWAERFNLKITAPYITLPIELVKNDRSKVNLVVMPKNSMPYHKAKQLQELYPVQYLDTIEECYQAVADGRAKTTYANSYVNSCMMEKKEFRGLSTSPYNEGGTEVCMGMYKGVPKELISIMEKVTQRGTSDEVNNFAMLATLEMEDHSFANLIYKNPDTAIGMLIILFAIIIIAMFVYMRARYRRGKIMQYNAVTGTWNFSKFVTEADKILQSNNFIPDYVIFHVNICKFRFLNDNYGFDIGNQVLHIFGESLEKFMKQGEVYGSLWADHFVCMARCKNEGEIRARSIELINYINEEVRKICDFRLTVKAGGYFITEEDIKEGKNANNLLQYANHALANINDSYKNTMAFFNQDLKKEIESFRLVNQDMINAFYDKQFVAYYQPKYNIYTNKIIGAEALVRWLHPEKGIMQPGDFLPYFEKSGFIVEVDLYILKKLVKI